MPIRILAPDDPGLRAYQAMSKTHTHLDITLDIIPFAAYRARLDAALDADEPPYDVVFAPGHLWLPELAAAGRIAPLDDHFATLPAVYTTYAAETLFPSATADSQYNGKTYLLPLFSDGHILFYDPKRVPIEATTTTVAPRDIVTLCTQATAPNGGAVIALKAHPSEIFLDWLPYLLDRTGGLLNTDNQPIFYTDEGVAALTDYVGLTKYAPSNTRDYNNEAVADALRRAEVAMAVTWGGQAAPIFRADGSRAPETYRAVSLTTPWNVNWGASVPASLTPQRQQAAVSALLQLHTPDLDTHVLMAAGSPIRTTTYTPENLAAYTWLAAQQQLMERAHSLPPLPEIGSVLGVLYGEVFAAFVGKKTPEQALATAETAVHEALA
jgi:multiple sugar transport system substrate-binding protein